MGRGVRLILTAVLMVGLLIKPASAAGERGTIRVVMPAELAGKPVTLYSVEAVSPEETALAGEYASGWEKELSGTGTAMFTGLPEGMYLIAIENMLAVLVTLPEEDGSWMAEVAPGVGYISPETGQPITPVLWAMGMILSAFGIGIWYEAWHKRKRK